MAIDARPAEVCTFSGGAISRSTLRQAQMGGAKGGSGNLWWMATWRNSPTARGEKGFSYHFKLSDYT